MHEKQIHARHESGMRFVVTTGSGHKLVMDDGVGDAGARPTEVLLASLVACTAMDIASLLVKKRQPVTGYSVEARGRQQDEYPQVFTWIELVHVVEGTGIDEVAVRRCIELSATKYCPISAMLSAGPTEIHHRFRIHEPAGPDRDGEVMVTGPNTAVLAPVPAPVPPVATVA